MAKTRTSRSLFASLAERAGLALTKREFDEMHATYHRVEAMTERVRAGGKRPVAAEPAVIFKPSRKPS